MKICISACLTVAVLCFGVLSAQAGSPGGDDNNASGKALSMLGAAIPVSNLDRSLDFYTKGLGLQATPRRDAGEVIEEPLIFPGGGAYLILLWKKTPDEKVTVPPATQRIILNVPDLKSLVSRLEAGGFHLKGAINENPQHHYAVAHVDDPDGNHLELVQRVP